jgi:hypothetical protein
MFLDLVTLWSSLMENNPFYFHIIFGAITEVRTHKQANNLFLLDSTFREREYRYFLKESLP